MGSRLRRKILLLGASGFVGGGIWMSLIDRHEVIGASSSKRVASLRTCDLNDASALDDILHADFDFVIHAAGLVDLEKCERDPGLAHSLNVDSVEFLSQRLDHRRTKLVYLSSDYVFDGHKSDPYTEQDPTNPSSVYGCTKVAAESLLADSRHLVVRIPIVYGFSPFSNRFIERFASPKTPAQTDVVCGPLYLPSLAPALEQLWDLSGIVHFSGREAMTRYDLMRRTRDALRVPTEIVPVRNVDSTNAQLRPPRLVLKSVRHHLSGLEMEVALRDLASRVGAVDHHARLMRSGLRDSFRRI